MTTFNLAIEINNEPYSETQLNRYKYERALHFLHEVIDLGVTPKTQDGQPVTAIALNWMAPDAVLDLAVATHTALGPEGTLDLFKTILIDSDTRWHTFNQRPIDEQGCWVGTTHITAHGIDPASFGTAMGTVQNGDLPFQIMPEHYYVAGDVTTEQQTIMETFGMLGEPTLTYGTGSKTIPDYADVQRLADHPGILSGATFLKHDNFNIHVGAVHQIQPLDNGLDIVSSYFCPKDAPKAIADGHTIHFALELGGALQLIANQK
ncbi:hypothetical protein AYR62_13465 [Secundilactobacillus paracollinoides]|uniref:hypothetical protein n=1 Tax=Secundilactobacillus paracollinoides TaxID=240427 RepID=UPI0006D1AC0F|nr:hypothetical protein [Secundilactobacillus paracollinoides]ANZ64985.1 hypothetical protein AYR62_13465 [Secundilactobacillus paracollinoides]KRL78852.1 hypothetical protein FC17_GL000868 [Secundilactobacillus paracollinoides DSM 15502 = JCM 11969]